MNRTAWIIAGLCAAAGIAGYAAVGAPFMPDAPMSDRQAELAAKNPGDMTPAETLARLERLTRERPGDAQPHFFIGELLRGQGRDSDAVRAYQSALRRDADFVPAMVALADALTRSASGAIGKDARRLYARAYTLDQDEVRAGFMAGLGLWRDGETERAEQAWSALYAPLDEDDSRRVMLDAWIAQARSDE